MPLAHGRPRKLNPKVQNDIITAIQTGATLEIAAHYAGVSYHAFNNWMTRGREEWGRVQDAREAVREVVLTWRSEKRPSRADSTGWKKIALVEVHGEVVTPRIGKPPPRRTRSPIRHIPDRLPPETIQAIRIKPKERAFVDFYKSVNGANAVAAVLWLKVIDTTAMQDANWAAWQLRYRFPKDYGGGKREIELSTPPDQPLQVNQQVSGEVIVKVPQIDHIANVLRILGEAGALESGALDGAGSGAEAEADQIHSNDSIG